MAALVGLVSGRGDGSVGAFGGGGNMALLER